jgi:hypothetical protein
VTSLFTRCEFVRLVGHVEGYSSSSDGGGGSMSLFLKVREVSFRSTPGCCKTEVAHHHLMRMILFTLLWFC